MLKKMIRKSTMLRKMTKVKYFTLVCFPKKNDTWYVDSRCINLHDRKQKKKKKIVKIDDNFSFGVKSRDGKQETLFAKLWFWCKVSKKVPSSFMMCIMYSV